MCSPYLTGSLGIMLCLVTFNYWTVSTQNSDLVQKVEEVQQQLQFGSKHIQSLEEETNEIRKQVKKYKDKVAEEKEMKKEVEMKYKDMSKQREDYKNKLDAMTLLKSEGEETEKKLLEDKEMQEKAMDRLRDELEEAKVRVESLQTNMTSCLAELANAIQKVPAVENPIPPRHLGGSGSLGVGQLPDVDPQVVSVIRKETPGAGLTIVSNSSKKMLNIVNNVGVSPSAVVEVKNLSSSRKPVSSSQRQEVGSNQLGVAPAPKIVVNEGGVMPLPNNIKSDRKIGNENLDNAEDDSHIIQNENGPEGKKDIQDDDQNPDGQIDETVNMDKQHYLIDKAAEELGEGDEEGQVGKSNEFDNNLEDEDEDDDGIMRDNLDNLKESLNKVET